MLQQSNKIGIISLFFLILGGVVALKVSFLVKESGEGLKHLSSRTNSTVNTESPYDYKFKLEKLPFRICKGTGNSPVSRYANESLNIVINPSSIRIVRPNGPIETYASMNGMCGVKFPPQEKIVCNYQEEDMDGRIYTLKKSCSSLIPGTNRSNFQFQLALTLNLKEVNGVKTAEGSLTCVANSDGFRGITLSACR